MFCALLEWGTNKRQDCAHIAGSDRLVVSSKGLARCGDESRGSSVVPRYDCWKHPAELGRAGAVEGHGRLVGAGPRSKQNRGRPETSTSGTQTLSGLLTRLCCRRSVRAELAQAGRYVGGRDLGCRVRSGAGRTLFFVSFEWLQLGAVANHQSRPRQAGTKTTSWIRQKVHVHSEWLSPRYRYSETWLMGVAALGCSRGASDQR